MRLHLIGVSALVSAMEADNPRATPPEPRTPQDRGPPPDPRDPRQWLGFPTQDLSGQ